MSLNRKPYFNVRLILNEYKRVQSSGTFELDADYWSGDFSIVPVPSLLKDALSDSIGTADNRAFVRSGSFVEMLTLWDGRSRNQKFMMAGIEIGSIKITKSTIYGVC